MTVVARDPWADARAVATGAELDARVRAARRRLRLRWGATAAIGIALIIGYVALAVRLTDDVEPWPTPAGVFRVWPWLFGLAAALMLVGLLTTARARTSGGLVVPLQYLPRTERRWLRKAIATGAPIPDERRDVALDAARRDAREAARLPDHLGWILLLSVSFLVGPSPVFLLPYALLVGWRGTRAVVDQIRGYHARRWLRLNAS